MYSITPGFYVTNSVAILVYISSPFEASGFREFEFSPEER